MRTIWMIALAAALVAAGCNKKESAEGQGAAAKANVKPGSHEDWCEEHGVPETQCTKCNPSLIPAFKATGDWCDQHKLPKSQDRECNPGLKITRPPKT